MTMPFGATEEPTVTEVERQTVAVEVVSSKAKPGKSIGTEFGRWRTVLVSNTVGPNSITPGAQRLLVRSLRRHRAHIIVNSTGGTGQQEVVGTAPAPGANYTYTNNTGSPQELLSAYYQLVTDATAGNRNPGVIGQDASASNLFTSRDNTAVVASSTIVVSAFQGSGVVNNASGTTNLPLPTNTTIPPGGNIILPGALGGSADQISQIRLVFAGQSQSSTDGVIVGSREEISSGQPAIPGQLGGYLQIGDSVRWEVQAELWVCYPATNGGSVYVTICDEVYASDPDSSVHYNGG